jgi:transporter family protein
MFRALQKADVSQVGPVDKLSMPLGIVLAVMLLGERPTTVNWIGILMIALGAFLAAHR